MKKLERGEGDLLTSSDGGGRQRKGKKSGKGKGNGGNLSSLFFCSGHSNWRRRRRERIFAGNVGKKKRRRGCKASDGERGGRRESNKELRGLHRGTNHSVLNLEKK